MCINLLKAILYNNLKIVLSVCLKSRIISRNCLFRKHREVYKIYNIPYIQNKDDLKNILNASQVTSISNKHPVFQNLAHCRLGMYLRFHSSIKLKLN